MCKWVDEIGNNNPLLFSIFPIFNEESKIIGDVSNRLRTPFTSVKEIFPNIFSANDELPLDDESVVKILSELQSISITKIGTKKFIEGYIMFLESFFHHEDSSDPYLTES